MPNLSVVCAAWLTFNLLSPLWLNTPLLWRWHICYSKALTNPQSTCFPAPTIIVSSAFHAQNLLHHLSMNKSRRGGRHGEILATKLSVEVTSTSLNTSCLPITEELEQGIRLVGWLMSQPQLPPVTFSQPALMPSSSLIFGAGLYVTLRCTRWPFISDEGQQGLRVPAVLNHPRQHQTARTDDGEHPAFQNKDELGSEHRGRWSRNLQLFWNKLKSSNWFKFCHLLKVGKGSFFFFIWAVAYCVRQKIRIIHE